MYESLVDPRTRASTEAKDAAFTLAYKTDVSYFDWLHRPGNEYRRKRFDIAMVGGQHLMPAHLIFEGIYCVYSIHCCGLTETRLQDLTGLRSPRGPLLWMSVEASAPKHSS